MTRSRMLTFEPVTLSLGPNMPLAPADAQWRVQISAAAVSGALARTAMQSPLWMAGDRSRPMRALQRLQRGTCRRAALITDGSGRAAPGDTVDWLIQSAKLGGAVTRGRGWAGASHWRYSEAAGGDSQEPKAAKKPAKCAQPHRQHCGDCQFS